MSARGRMTMRAVVERNTASGTDAHGHPVKPAFTAHLSSQPCWVWSKQRREIVDGSKIAIVEDLRALFPLGADVVAGDEIASIDNRRGAELLAGRFQIETVQRKHNHIEAALERVT